MQIAILIVVGVVVTKVSQMCYIEIDSEMLRIGRSLVSAPIRGVYQERFFTDGQPDDDIEPGPVELWIGDSTIITFYDAHGAENIGIARGPNVEKHRGLRVPIAPNSMPGYVPGGVVSMHPIGEDLGVIGWQIASASLINFSDSKPECTCGVRFECDSGRFGIVYYEEIFTTFVGKSLDDRIQDMPVRIVKWV